jgi:predicted dehydrogenase
MKPLVALVLAMGAPLCAADRPRIAIIGLLHSHVWGHLGGMLKGAHADFVAIAETNPELIAEARKREYPNAKKYDDYRKMLDEAKPAIVWAFVENNRHLEIVEA